MRFPYPTDIHPKCRDWLRRSSVHLSTLSEKQRAAWLREWIPAANDFPLDDGVTAFDRHRVVLTLRGWQDAPVLAEVA